MEREIKYKAKCIDNGEWVYGDLIHRNGWNKKHIIIRVFDDGFDAYEEHEVIPETVCQCIGLNDKNGVEIYDKDIADVNGLRYEIYFDQDRAMYVYRDKRKSMYNISRHDNVKIVGNMIDNPKMLEV